MHTPDNRPNDPISFGAQLDAVAIASADGS